MGIDGGDAMRPWSSPVSSPSSLVTWLPPPRQRRFGRGQVHSRKVSLAVAPSRPGGIPSSPRRRPCPVIECATRRRRHHYHHRTADWQWRMIHCFYCVVVALAVVASFGLAHPWWPRSSNAATARIPLAIPSPGYVATAWVILRPTSYIVESSSWRGRKVEPGSVSLTSRFLSRRPSEPPPPPGPAAVPHPRPPRTPVTVVTTTTTATPPPSARPIATPLRSDLHLIFGSDAGSPSRHSPPSRQTRHPDDEAFPRDDDDPHHDATTGGETRDLDPDDDDDDDAQWQSRRAARVAELLDHDDKQYREHRKTIKWGQYANITSVADIAAVAATEQARIAADNDRKIRLAQQAGVTLTLLEPKEVLEVATTTTTTTTTTTSTSATNSGAGGFNQTAISSENRIALGLINERNTGVSGWFADVDEELKLEWATLTAGDPIQSPEENDSGSSQNNDDGDADDRRPRPLDPSTTSDSPLTMSGLGVQVDESTGKMVSRDALAGVRVGSVGGWSLEVFPGDFVVHRKYGIGRFERMTLRSKSRLTAAEKTARDARRAEILTTELRKLSAESGSGVTPDQMQAIRSTFGTADDTDPVSNPQTTVLEIAYADGLVHVPVDRAYRLSRYRAGDAVVKPKLSRVKGEAWANAKRKVEENTLELAQDVLALYATRETLYRPPFHPSTEEQVNVFESTFGYEPTPDQNKCFEDVANDMVWRARPMDRLVCGDVGFGKTEVAIRALYRAVANGKQAALLAPTGVLAAQHYKNIVKRMGPDSPFNVSVTLLRGGMTRTSKAGREIRDQIATGTARLIIGTHALLSQDLRFQDLGLLVIDEEQRFGVKQKERLKLICDGIDVLTLSATPIPRTLQMSLSGIRDTSTIRSPPPMRKPTITYVQDLSEDLIQQAIGQELDRGGQCYYVVPRISMLEQAQSMIQRLFPGIRIIQAHGRMQRSGAEENVAAFAEGNYDILLATTVIENGVDIPSVNTIIVQNSQAFGMSTLYQLRGRVGRSDVQGFAFFLYDDDRITEQASMRLTAIGELHELGSGFDVANRDLEIRGAGSLLGTEQSGMASKVGFDLYMRMLKRSIRRLRGLDLPAVPRTNILVPGICSPDFFTIPKSFIPSLADRYREESNVRLAESTAKLVNITNLWKDTFGPLPSEVQSNLKSMHLHACTRRLGVDLVGLIEVVGDEDVKRLDCVLRSPGLRPRHWAAILEQLPKNVAPKGINVCFPARFTISGQDEVYVGGRRVKSELLVEDDTMSEEHEDSEWNSMDQDESEVLKDISSAANVKNMDEIDVDHHSRLVIPNFGADADGKAVDRLLKVLLPIAKIVYEKQEDDKDNAKVAANLRNKRELLQNRKKSMTANQLLVDADFRGPTSPGASRRGYR